MQKTILTGGIYMDRRNLTVIGSYSTAEEATDVIERLRDEGYKREDIVVFANEQAAESFGFTEKMKANVETAVDKTKEADEKPSLWDRIKDAFSFDTYDETASNDTMEYSAETDPLFDYRDDIVNGKIVVTVRDYRQKTTNPTAENRAQSDPPLGDDIQQDPTNTVDDGLTGDNSILDDSVPRDPGADSALGGDLDQNPDNDPLRR